MRVPPPGTLWRRQPLAGSPAAAAARLRSAAGANFQCRGPRPRLVENSCIDILVDRARASGAVRCSSGWGAVFFRGFAKAAAARPQSGGGRAARPRAQRRADCNSRDLMWGVVSVARRGTLGPSASRVARCWRHGGLREVVRRHDSSGCVVSALPERVATTPVAVSTPTRTLYRGPLYPRAVRAIGSSSSESATRRRVDIGQGALIDIDVSAVGIPVQVSRLCSDVCLVWVLTKPWPPVALCVKIEAIWDESCFIDVEPTGSSSAANLSITEGRADSPAGTMLSISANSREYVLVWVCSSERGC